MQHTSGCVTLLTPPDQTMLLEGSSAVPSATNLCSNQAGQAAAYHLFS